MSTPPGVAAMFTSKSVPSLSDRAPLASTSSGVAWLVLPDTADSSSSTPVLSAVILTSNSRS